MFQQLSQGAILPILYRNNPRVVEGRVLSVNTHLPSYNPSQPFSAMNGPVTDITVQVGNDTIPFAGLPANGVVANFPDKGMFISTDRAAVIREIESMVAASRQALGQMPVHQKMVQDCETLLLTLQPERKKEAEQAQELAAVKQQLSDLSGKFEQLIGVLSAKTGTPKEK